MNVAVATNSCSLKCEFYNYVEEQNKMSHSCYSLHTTCIAHALRSAVHNIIALQKLQLVDRVLVIIKYLAYGQLPSNAITVANTCALLWRRQHSCN